MTRAKIATKVSRSARWAFVESIFSAGASAATVIVVARFLGPAEFGRAGIALAAAAIVHTAMLGALPEALVRARSAHTAFTDALFRAATGIGAATAGVLALAAVVVGQATGDRLLAALIAVAGLSGIALGVAAVPMGLLLRKLRTRALVRRTIAGKVAGLVAGAGLAAAGAGPWALIASNLVFQSVCAVQLVLTMRPPRRRAADPDVGATIRLGIFGGGQATVGMLTTRGFILAFGAVHGPYAVGLFNFAMRLVEESAGIVVTALRRVTVTSFAAAKRSGVDVRPMFRRGTRLIAYVSSPLFLGLAAVAPDAVPLVFGPQWTGAVFALQLMLVLWVVRATRMLVNAIMIVEGRQRTMLVWAAVSAVATFAVFAVAAPFGPEASTWAFAMTLTGVLFGGRLFSNATGIGPLEQVMAGARPIAFALVMAAAVVALRLGPLAGLDAWARVALSGLAGAAVFAGLALALDRGGVRDLVNMLRR